MTPALDLTTYPLDQPESAAYRLLRDRARADLNRFGLFDLPGLMRAEALARAVQQVGPLIAAQGFRHARRHNIYFRPEVPGLPADHPALQTHETVNHTVCTDQLAGTLVRELYQWRPLAGFLADVLQLPRLYTMADPLAGVTVLD